MKCILSYVLKRFWRECNDGFYAIMIVACFSAAMAGVFWAGVKYPDVTKAIGKILIVTFCLCSLTLFIEAIRRAIVYVIDLTRDASAHCREQGDRCQKS